VKSHDVRFWATRPNKTAKGASYTVRWTVAGREKSHTLSGKARAERYKSRLLQAADKGEAFDVDSGLPDSLAREISQVTWFEHASAFMDARWPKHAAKGRVSLAEGLIAVTPVLVKSQRGAPDPVVLRQALRRWAFNPPRRDTARPYEVEAALRWLARASVPMLALEESSTVARALDACGRKLDGSAAAAQYYRRWRRVFYAALKYAVREGRLSANPLDRLADREWRPPEVDQAVDRRRVPNPDQMRALLMAIGSTGLSQGPRLVALYGCMYYGMLRPSEAVSLLLDECYLPAEGWGGWSSVRCARPPGGIGPTTARCTRSVRPRAARETRCAGCRFPLSWYSCSASMWSSTVPVLRASCSAPIAAAPTSRPRCGRCSGRRG
jgi:hypothetical protein